MSHPLSPRRQPSLPQPPTAFIGRCAEVAELVALLCRADCRLLTLVGPGGMGKTRLALRVGEQLAAPGDGAATHFPDGVVFVALQGVASPDQLVPTLVKALDWPYYEGRHPVQELLHFLSEKRLLLILDNFEHLYDAGPLLQTLLAGAPGVRLLVTSRRLLNLTEEWLFQVEGLALPSGDDHAAVAASDAVRLFCARAARVRHDFSLAEAQAAVVEICRLVEGTPLALELAASWLRSMPCTVIAAEIRRGLDILQTDQAGVPNRHRTMSAVFDHSWRLLTPRERALCRGLSVFRGGFLPAAAAHIVGATLAELAALVDKSLLHLAGGDRYALHELQRQYAAARLAEWPDEQQTVTDRHAAFYVQMISLPALRFLTDGSAELLAALEADVDNLYAAWAWAVARRWFPTLYEAIEGVYWFSWCNARHQEGEQALRRLIEALRPGQTDDDARRTYGRALALHGAMGNWLGQTDTTLDELRQGVALLRTMPDAQRELGLAVGSLGWAQVNVGDLAAAKPLLLEAVALDQASEEYVILGFIDCLLGEVAYRQGRYAESAEWYAQALQLGERIGDWRTVAHARRELGQLASLRGDFAAAQQQMTAALDLARRHNLASFVVSTLVGLGELAELTGDLARAAELLQHAVATARLWGKPPTLAHCLAALAHVCTSQGELAAAAALYGEAEALVATIHSPTRRRELLAGQGDLAVASGDPTTALRLFEEVMDLARAAGDRLALARASLQAGRAALRQGRAAEVWPRLRLALETGLHSGFVVLLVDALAVGAAWMAETGDLPAAAQVAAEVEQHGAASAMARQTATRLLAATGHAPRLSAQAATAPDVAVVAAALLMQGDAVAVKVATGAAVPCASTPAPLLSQRELHILRLVAGGRSNHQIAAELHLTLGTVKSHLHHIYTKLNVERRTEAVAVARGGHLL